MLLLQKNSKYNNYRTNGNSIFCKQSFSEANWSEKSCFKVKNHSGFQNDQP